MLITYKKLSSNQKSTYYYILCYFPIQFCVSLGIGCTGKRSGISVKGLRKFLSSEGLCCLCLPDLYTVRVIIESEAQICFASSLYGRKQVFFIYILCTINLAIILYGSVNPHQILQFIF